MTTRCDDPPHSDFPLVTLLRERRVRGRYTHTCNVCGTGITQGERHTYFVYTDDEALAARLRTARTHFICPPAS
jgi:hypothetical protein